MCVPALSSTAPGAGAQTTWDSMYAAVVQQFGLDPATFQLVYPYTLYNWPPNNPGFINAAEYDFCSTIPQWSTVGKYISSGAGFDTAYQQFLNLVVPSSLTAQQQSQLDAAYNAVQAAASQYNGDYAAAAAAYQSQTSENQPTMSEWLASPAGASYAASLQADQSRLQPLQQAYANLIAGFASTQLASAQAAMISPANWLYLSNPVLGSLPPVPGWSLGSRGAHPTAVAAARQRSFTFANLTASSPRILRSAGAASVAARPAEPFWRVLQGAAWRNLPQLEADPSTVCTIQFSSWQTLPVNTGGWYSGVSAFANGPFRPGWSAQPNGTDSNIFGPGGLLPLLKTALLVGYNPTCTVSTSAATASAAATVLAAAQGFGIGAFEFVGSNAPGASGWFQVSGQQIQGAAAAAVIFGVLVRTLP